MILDIAGEKFDVDSSVLDEFLKAMEQTEQDGNEHGFLLCDTGNGIVPGAICTGNTCSIHLTDCAGKGTEIGSFHSHPDVISFSLMDYITTLKRAEKHPGHKNLNCVGLKNAGIRCKAVTGLPSKDFKFPFIDTEENREKVKPFFTKRINISKEKIQKLKQGIPFDQIPEDAAIIAIDEEGGAEVFTDKFETPSAPAGPPKPPQKKPPTATGAPSSWDWDVFPTLPPSTAQKYKTEVGPKGNLVMVPIPQSEFVGEVQFILLSDIEVPNPKLIALGESMGYADAITPVQVLPEKVNGKWKIHDGRHRLVAWKMAGYKVAPIQVVNPTPGSEATVYPNL